MRDANSMSILRANWKPRFKTKTEVETKIETDIEKFVIAIHKESDAGDKEFIGFIVETGAVTSSMTLNLIGATQFAEREIPEKIEEHRFPAPYLTSAVHYKEILELLLSTGQIGRTPAPYLTTPRALEVTPRALEVTTPAPEVTTPAQVKKYEMIVYPAAAAETSIDAPVERIKESKTDAISPDLENKFTVVVYTNELKANLKGLLKKDRRAGNRVNLDMLTFDFNNALFVSQSDATEIMKEYRLYSPYFSFEVMQFGEMKIEVENAKKRESSEWWKTSHSIV